jgi:hypothetical protein
MCWQGPCGLLGCDRLQAAQAMGQKAQVVPLQGWQEGGLQLRQFRC